MKKFVRIKIQGFRHGVKVLEEIYKYKLTAPLRKLEINFGEGEIQKGFLIVYYKNKIIFKRRIDKASNIPNVNTLCENIKRRLSNPEKWLEKAYKVGYKKPPKHTQFKPGESGNSKGRPKIDRRRAELLNITVKEFIWLLEVMGKASGVLKQ